MNYNISMSDVLQTYACEDAAIRSGHEFEIERWRIERECAFEAFAMLRPTNVETCIECLNHVLHVFSQGSNMGEASAAAVRPFVEGALKELRANGLSLGFLLAIRAAIDAAPGDDMAINDMQVNDVLHNVLAFAGGPKRVVT